MIGWEALLIIGAAVVLAFGIHYPTSHLNPQPFPFFMIVTGIVTVLIPVVAWLAGKKANSTAIAVLMVAMIFIWWWIAMFLWVNTYGE